VVGARVVGARAIGEGSAGAIRGACVDIQESIFG